MNKFTLRESYERLSRIRPKLVSPFGNVCRSIQRIQGEKAIEEELKVVEYRAET